MKKVLIYCRESRDDGSGHYDRIETQRDILVDYCEKQDLGVIIGIVMDDNKTGTSFERLKPIKEMVISGEVDIILCKDASRLGRNTLESLMFTEFLLDRGVELVFESERYDEDLFPLIAWFNERRVKDDSVKIRRVLRHKMEEGAMVIKAPYGYVKDGNRLLVDPCAAPVVQEIFDLFLQGLTFGEVADVMNSKGFPTPSKHRNQHSPVSICQFWNRQHVARIINHRVYTGDMVYGMREKVSYKSKKRVAKPESDWIIIPDHHQAIISKETYYKAQNRITRGSQSKPRQSGDNTFSGMLFCGRCGSRMVKTQRISMKSSYVCGKSHREGSIKHDLWDTKGCSPHRIYTADLSTLVINYIEKMLTDQDFTRRLNKELEEYPSPGDRVQEHIRFYEKKVSELHKKISLVYDDRLAGLVPDFLYRNKLDEINRELSFCENCLQEYRLALKTSEEQSNSPLSVVEMIAQINKISIDRAIIYILFDKIIIFNPGEVSDDYLLAYGLTPNEADALNTRGGLLFVRGYPYQILMSSYETQQHITPRRV